MTVEATTVLRSWSYCGEAEVASGSSKAPYIINLLLNLQEGGVPELYHVMMTVDKTCANPETA